MSPTYSAGELAERIGTRLVGDAGLTLTGVASLDRAGAHDVSFFSDQKFAARLSASDAGAVIVAGEGDAPQRVQFVADDPYLALRGAILAFHRSTPIIRPGIHPTAAIDPSAQIDASAEIGAHTTIEAGARIGADCCVAAGGYIGSGAQLSDECYLYPRVTVLGGVRLGHRVIVHSGAVLGADGFGFARSDEGALKVPQIGGVRVEDDVEIGANTTIDRGTLDDTHIGKGTKIDNLVMIGHNVEIGHHCIIVSQVGIAGSTQIGNGVVIAGQAGIADHLKIGDGVTIAAKSGVPGHLEAGKTYMGAPAREASEARRLYAYMSRLPDWARRLRDLEEKVTGKA